MRDGCMLNKYRSEGNPCCDIFLFSEGGLFQILAEKFPNLFGRV